MLLLGRGVGGSGTQRRGQADKVPLFSFPDRAVLSHEGARGVSGGGDPSAGVEPLIGGEPPLMGPTWGLSVRVGPRAGRCSSLGAARAVPSRARPQHWTLTKRLR